MASTKTAALLARYWQVLLMQSWPIEQPDCAVHCGVASLCETQMPADEQTGIRASMREH
jgi:hypothetical protein